MDIKPTDVNVQRYESLGELFSALGSQKRLQAYILLAHGYEPTEITDEIDISRSGLQNYINDFKQLSLFEKQGKSLVPTEAGNWMYEQLVELEKGYSEFLQSELMEDFHGIGGFASPGGQQFVQKLFEEHPEEAKEVLDGDNIELDKPSDFEK